MISVGFVHFELLKMNKKKKSFKCFCSEDLSTNISSRLSDGLKAYTAPVGHVMQLSSVSVYLNDSTYDGSTEKG